jgi:hypothetical protein
MSQRIASADAKILFLTPLGFDEKAHERLVNEWSPTYQEFFVEAKASLRTNPGSEKNPVSRSTTA